MMSLHIVGAVPMMIRTRITDEQYTELRTLFPDESSDYAMLQKIILRLLNSQRKKAGLAVHMIEPRKRGQRKPRPLIPERVFTEMRLDDLAAELGITQKEVVERCDKLNIKVTAGRVDAAGVKQLLA